MTLDDIKQLPVMQTRGTASAAAMDAGIEAAGGDDLQKTCVSNTIQG